MRALSKRKSLHWLWVSCRPAFFLRYFYELFGFVIGQFWYSIGPRGGGCQTALAGARVRARLFLRAYLALHPHARLCFLLFFPGLYRCFVENEGVGCSA